MKTERRRRTIPAEVVDPKTPTCPPALVVGVTHGEMLTALLVGQPRLCWATGAPCDCCGELGLVVGRLLEGVSA